MTRPPAVDALFAGRTLPKSKAALDEVREYIKGLERIKDGSHTAHDAELVHSALREIGHSWCDDSLEMSSAEFLRKVRIVLRHIAKEDNA